MHSETSHQQARSTREYMPASCVMQHHAARSTGGRVGELGAASCGCVRRGPCTASCHMHQQRGQQQQAKTNHPTRRGRERQQPQQKEKQQRRKATNKVTRQMIAGTRWWGL